MKLPSKKTTLYGLALIFVLFILPKLWHPGISIYNQGKIDSKIKSRIGRVFDPEARIISLQFTGEGAFRKASYCSMRYLLPEDEYSQYLAVNLVRPKKSFDMISPPVRDGITYEDGLSLEEFDFAHIADNIKKIRADFESENITWMGLQAYTIEYNLEEKTFVHWVNVFYETESNWNKILRKIGFIVTPNESVSYKIRQNGTGELERLEDFNAPEEEAAKEPEELEETPSEELQNELSQPEEIRRASDTIVPIEIERVTDELQLPESDDRPILKELAPDSLQKIEPDTKSNN